MNFKNDIKPSKTKTLKFIKPIFWFYSLLLVLLSVLPVNSSNNVINHTTVLKIRLDYFVHFAIYIPWIILLQQLTKKNFRSNTLETCLLILAGLFFSFANEGIQYFLPYRAFNINDLMGNALGIILGSIVFFLRFPKAPNNLTQSDSGFYTSVRQKTDNRH